MLIHLGNYTVGIISGSEDWNVIKVSCKELFSDIIEVVSQKHIIVDNHIIPSEFFLSGDYKVTELQHNSLTMAWIMDYLQEYLLLIVCLVLVTGPGVEWTNIWSCLYLL